MNERKTVKLVVDNVAQQNARDFWQQFDNMQEKINNLQSKIDKANKILDKYAKTEVEDYSKIIKFYKELRSILKEDK